MIRRTLPEPTDKQVNIRLSEAQVERVEAIAEAEATNRTDVLRTWIEDGISTYDHEGALLSPEVRERLSEAAAARGLTETGALQEAVGCYLRVLEKVAEVNKPRRFPPREVMLELAERGAYLDSLLGTGGE